MQPVLRLLFVKTGRIIIAIVHSKSAEVKSRSRVGPGDRATGTKRLGITCLSFDIAVIEPLFSTSLTKTVQYGHQPHFWRDGWNIQKCAIKNTRNHIPPSKAFIHVRRLCHQQCQLCFSDRIRAEIAHLYNTWYETKIMTVKIAEIVQLLKHVIFQAGFKKQNLPPKHSTRRFNSSRSTTIPSSSARSLPSPTPPRAPYQPHTADTRAFLRPDPLYTSVALLSSKRYNTRNCYGR